VITVQSLFLEEMLLKKLTMTTTTDDGGSQKHEWNSERESYFIKSAYHRPTLKELYFSKAGNIP
jgi:hypothetical protein